MDPSVREAVARFLTLADTEAPGLVEGLYLVGSVALGDFRPHASDIDFLAVTAAPVTGPEFAALTRAHAALAAWRRRPYLDGAYVTWADLGRDPSRAAAGAGSHEGRLAAREAGGCDPVAWHTLAGHGVTVRGPRRQELDVWTDRAVLAAWTRRNLDEYWRRWLERSSRLCSRFGLASVHPWGPTWSVLGISRLHYTLATGEITSKRGAGRYARERFGARWHRIIDECLRLRAGERGRRYLSPLRRRRDALAFAAMAIEDAHRIGPVDGCAHPD